MKLADFIYLKTAGLTIKINFLKTTELVYKDSLKKNILKTYKSFITYQNNKAVDFTITVNYKNNFILKTDKFDSALNFFFREISETEAETFYFLSLDLFNTLLIFVLRKLLLRHNGFIFHCSAVIFNKKLLVLSGKIGSGKSTALRLLRKKFEPFADDTMIVRKISGKYYAYQSPLFEKNQIYKNSEIKFALDKIFMLKKSPIFKIRSIDDRNKIFQKLISQTSLNYFLVDKSGKYKSRQILSKIKEFTDSVDFYYLYFAKNKNKLIKLVENITDEY